MKSLATLALFALILAVQGAQAQGWSVEPAPDDLAVRWVATVTNEDGHRLTLWRTIKRIKFQAMMRLELQGQTPAQDPLPELAIDDTDFRPIENWGTETVSFNGNRVTWLLWSATYPEIGPDDSLQAWMRGSQVTVRYHTGKGTRDQATFSLAGSANAIQRIVTGTYK